MPSTDLLFRILARDMTGPELDRVREKIDAQDKKLRGLKVAGTVAAAGFALMAAAGVKAFEEQEQANNRLIQIYKSMGDVTGELSAKAIDYANVLEKQTGIDSALIEQGQAKLATFKAVSDAAAVQAGIFDRTTKAALDLSEAGFGDMASTSVQLGKALQDPIKGLTALGKSGVTFTAAEKAMIKSMVESGDQLGAMNVILEAVETQVGGTAEATNTASRSMATAWGNIQETVGEVVYPAFEALSNVVEGTADVLGGLPKPAQQAIVGVAGLGAAALVLTPRIMATVTALKALAAAHPGAVSGLKKLGPAALGAGSALAAAAVAYMGFANAQNNAEAAVASLTETLDKQSGAATDATYTKVGEMLSGDITVASEWEQLAAKGFGRDRIIADLVATDGRIDSTIAQLKALREAAAPGSDDRSLLDALLSSIGNTSEVLVDTRGAWENLTQSEKDAAAAAKNTASAVDTAGEAAFDAKGQVESLDAAMQKLTGSFSRADAVAAYKGSLDDLAGVLDDLTPKEKAQARALDLGTEAGRGAYAALKDVVAAAGEDIAAKTTQKTSTEQLRAMTAKHKDEIYKVAESLGISRAAAAKYVEKLNGIPKTVKTQFVLNTAELYRDIAAIEARYAQLSSSGAARRTSRRDTLTAPSAGVARASGGIVTGPGTGTSDDIPAMLSNGEFVVNAEATKKHEALLWAINATGFAKGGKAATKEQREARLQKRRDAASAFGSAASGIRDSMLDFASVTGVDWGRYESELADVASATDALADARERLKDAGAALTAGQKDLQAVEVEIRRAQNLGDGKAYLDALAKKRDLEREVAEATRDNAAAQAEVTAAEKDVTKQRGEANNAKPNAKNLIRDFKDRVAKLGRFSGLLDKLRARGLSDTILSEIQEVGTEDGIVLAEAFLAGGKRTVNQLNATQRRANQAATKLGKQGAAFEQGSIQFQEITVPVKFVSADGEVLWKQLFAADRKSGGRKAKEMVKRGRG